MYDWSRLTPTMVDTPRKVGSWLEAPLQIVPRGNNLLGHLNHDPESAFQKSRSGAQQKQLDTGYIQSRAPIKKTCKDREAKLEMQFPINASKCCQRMVCTQPHENIKQMYGQYFPNDLKRSNSRWTHHKSTIAKSNHQQRCPECFGYEDQRSLQRLLWGTYGQCRDHEEHYCSDQCTGNPDREADCYLGAGHSNHTSHQMH